jgi:hypothetical protein
MVLRFAIPAATALLAGCARQVPIHAERVAELRRPAIVSRVEKGPTAFIARSDPGGLALFPGETDAKAVDQRIATNLGKKVSRFQVAERLRSELVRGLPTQSPWTRMVPAVDVASALETLLVESRDEPPDFNALRSLGADAVLDIAINDFGVARHENKVGLYATITAHLFTFDGNDTLYRRTFDVDDARDGRGELAPAALLRGAEDYRDALEDLLQRVGQAISDDLGGRRPATSPTPAGDTTSPASNQTVEDGGSP